jgi:hypothetical protein
MSNENLFHFTLKYFHHKYTTLAALTIFAASAAVSSSGGANVSASAGGGRTLCLPRGFGDRAVKKTLAFNRKVEAFRNYIYGGMGLGHCRIHALSPGMDDDTPDSNGGKPGYYHKNHVPLVKKVITSAFCIQA